jgi:hypothetical protein
MLEEPTVLYGEAIGSSYQRQHETLGKYFLRPSDPATSETATSARRREAEDSDQLALPIERD